MQQAGDDADDVHPHVGEDTRDSERVHEVRFAGRPKLAGVVLGGKLERFRDGGDIVFGAGFLDGGDQLIEESIERGSRGIRHGGDAIGLNCRNRGHNTYSSGPE